MEPAAVLPRHVLRVQLVPAEGQFLHGRARFHQLLVGAHVLDRVLIGLDHVRARRLITDPPRARDVDAEAIDADQIGVEGKDFVVLQLTRAALLEPRIGPGAGRQQAGFDPLAAALDVAGVQDRPDFVFAHARLYRRLHLVDRLFAGPARALHGQLLVDALDAARLLHRFLAAHDVEARIPQRVEAVEHDLVYTQPHVAAGVLTHQLHHLLREAVGGLLRPVAVGEVEHARPAAHFFDQRVEVAQERAVLVVPDHQMTVSGNQTGAERIVGVPQLHAGAVAGVADVQRVEQQHAAPVALVQGLDDPVEAVAAHGLQVRCLQPGCVPLLPREVGRADFDAVAVVRAAVVEGVAARAVDRHRRGSFGLGAGKGHDLAGVAVKLAVHCAILQLKLCCKIQTGFDAGEFIDLRHPCDTFATGCCDGLAVFRRTAASPQTAPPPPPAPQPSRG